MRNGAAGLDESWWLWFPCQTDKVGTGLLSQGSRLRISFRDQWFFEPPMRVADWTLTTIDLVC